MFSALGDRGGVRSEGEGVIMRLLMASLLLDRGGGVVGGTSRVMGIDVGDLDLVLSVGEGLATGVVCLVLSVGEGLVTGVVCLVLSVGEGLATGVVCWESNPESFEERFWQCG